MALSYLEVIGVMDRSNLYAAGSKLLIYVFICNNRNFTVG